MCGRFNIIDDPLTRFILAIVNGEIAEFSLETRYNIAPTEDIPIVLVNEAGEFELRNMRWWLVPSWSDGPSTKYSMFNAKSETLEKSRAFREPFKRRRCIAPVSGYYEWQKQGGVKLPHLVKPATTDGLAFAALWDCWRKGDQVIESCTIVTGQAPESMAALHHRIPLHLSPDEVNRWVSPDASPEELKILLAPKIKQPLSITPLSSYVGNSRHKDARCIEPLGDPVIVE